MPHIKRQLMAEQWDSFSRAAFTDPHISAIQKQEMRRAFYTGATAILFKVIQSFAPEFEPTEENLQIMTDLDQELNDFAKAVIEGRA